ncbi:MAG: hypothetical protein DBY04_03195 [Clostridiales bacterium]|nr:MAG: hypothetical protein DBY04_03195 [Clostridiales bacterium]
MKKVFQARHAMKDWNEPIYKYAVVDIGANSVRMNLYDIDTRTGAFTVFASARSMLGLAAYVKDEMLTADGAGKLFSVLREFLARANSVPCDGFFAFATASLRGLANSEEVLRNIKDKLGIEIEIISGRTETFYDFTAIRNRFPSVSCGTFIDMGGGSTEIAVFDADGIRVQESLPVGCVRLMKNFTNATKRDPFPDEKEVERIRQYVRQTISAYPNFRNVGGTAFFIGGTARASMRLHDADASSVSDGSTLSVSELKKTADAAICDARAGGNHIRSVVPDRAATIIPGLFAYLEIAAYMGLSGFILSTAGVREGYLIEFIRKMLPRRFQET